MTTNFDIKVDLRRVPAKVKAIVNDPRVLRELATTWAGYFEEYMPFDTGALVNSAEITDDGHIIYNSEYAHYMWYGKEYIWGWTPEGEKIYFSPPDERKFWSGDDIPGAWDSYMPHWEQYAYKDHKEDVAKHMTDFIKEL